MSAEQIATNIDAKAVVKTATCFDRDSVYVHLTFQDGTNIALSFDRQNFGTLIILTQLAGRLQKRFLELAPDPDNKEQEKEAYATVKQERPQFIRTLADEILGNLPEDEKQGG